jgi:hypothetical protein
MTTSKTNASGQDDSFPGFGLSVLQTIGVSGTRSPDMAKSRRVKVGHGAARVARSAQTAGSKRRKRGT